MSAQKPFAQVHQLHPKKETEKTPTKTSLMPVMTLTLVVFNIVLLSFMGFFLNKIWVRTHQISEQTKMASTPSSEKSHEAESGHAPAGNAAVTSEQNTLFPMDNFLVNITGDQGPKYLQVQMEFALSVPSLEGEMTQKKASIRDAVIMLLTTRTYKQLREASGMKDLRLDIVKAINRLISGGQVKEVYFTEFHFN